MLAASDWCKQCPSNSSTSTDRHHCSSVCNEPYRYHYHRKRTVSVPQLHVHFTFWLIAGGLGPLHNYTSSHLWLREHTCKGAMLLQCTLLVLL